MSEAVTSTSLITVCLNRESLEKSVSAEGGPASFESVFAFDFEDTSSSAPDITSISPEAVGQSSLNRIRFFADDFSVPLLVAPLLLRHLWNRGDAGPVVFAYPGIPDPRLLAARDMLDTGCEAVLLRCDGQPSIVVGLARNTRNERLVQHWADCVDRIDREALEHDFGFEDLMGGRMVEHLCDRIGSLRLAETLAPGRLSFAAHSFPAMVRSAIEKLLPESDLLKDDPLGNAAAVLNAPADGIDQDPNELVTRLMLFVRSTRPDLQEAFDLSKADGRHNFVDWFLERGESELALTPAFITPVQEARMAPMAVIETADPAGPAMEPNDSLHGAVPSSPEANFVSGTGVNLTGYARAEMGMGEQLRSCASALEAVEFPFRITDFKHGIIASNLDTRYEHWIRTDNPFDINLFHVNADQMGLALEKLGRDFFRGHYNIGYWEWELSEFPDEWLWAVDLMDEIWAPSKFVAEAISAKSKKPVIWMPLAVQFPVPDLQSRPSFRAKFGLPEDEFLFLFPFDFSSFSSRKNYRACIDAFRLAFGDKGGSARLVLKTIRHAHQKREFWDFLRTVGDDRRIYVLDRVLRQGEMRELIACCDSLVSLHRSEGFGLAIAEAMYLEKPVIVTNYSGNVDFTHRDNSCLVDYRLVPVKPGEYVFPEGQVWADADVEQAAGYMRRLVEDREYGAQLGRAARKIIRRQHSRKAVGARYKDRLKQIAAARNLLAPPGTGADRGEQVWSDFRPSVIRKVVSRLF